MINTTVQPLDLTQTLRKGLRKEGWGTREFQNTILFNPSAVYLHVYE